MGFQYVPSNFFFQILCYQFTFIPEKQVNCLFAPYSLQSLSRVQLFAIPWTTACQASCPSPTPGACSNSWPSSWWCHPTISFSVIPFSSWLQSFPASGCLLMSQPFTSGGRSIGALALTSVLPMNIQDWFPLGLTSLITLQSKGLSREFSNTTVQKYQCSASLVLSLFYGPTLTSIHDYWENHSFDYTDLCWQSNFSAF